MEGEPCLVIVASLAMTIVMVLFFVIRPPVICLKCGNKMIKENKILYICKTCGHTEKC